MRTPCALVLLAGAVAASTGCRIAPPRPSSGVRADLTPGSVKTAIRVTTDAHSGPEAFAEALRALIQASPSFVETESGDYVLEYEVHYGSIWQGVVAATVKAVVQERASGRELERGTWPGQPALRPGASDFAFERSALDLVARAHERRRPTAMACPVCRRRYALDLRFCEDDGARLEATRD